MRSLVLPILVLFLAVVSGCAPPPLRSTQQFTLEQVKRFDLRSGAILRQNIQLSSLDQQDVHPVTARDVERAEQLIIAPRFALVIGNGRYSDDAKSELNLPTSVNDATEMEQIFRAAGFQIIGGKAHIDVDYGAFNALLRESESALRSSRAPIFVLYFSGHGVSDGERNWLVPVGSRFGDASRYVSPNDVARRMSRAGAAVNILFLDACRQIESAPDVIPAIRPEPTPENTFIGFGAIFGDVATTVRSESQLSTYTKWLASFLPDSRIPTLSSIHANVATMVIDETEGRQIPVARMRRGGANIPTAVFATVETRHLYRNRFRDPSKPVEEVIREVAVARATCSQVYGGVEDQWPVFLRGGGPNHTAAYLNNVMLACEDALSFLTGQDAMILRNYI